jgi:hypothetical protein
MNVFISTFSIHFGCAGEVGTILYFKSDPVMFLLFISQSITHKLLFVINIVLQPRSIYGNNKIRGFCQKYLKVQQN